MRPRPYIPMAVRRAVLDRQIRFTHDAYRAARLESWANCRFDADGIAVQYGINLLFGWGAKVHLDHDPALILRVLDERTGEYDPPANDPDFLVYRAEADHDHKTFGRNPGASRTITTKGSDIWLKTKFARWEKSQQKSSTGSRGRSNAPKRKIPSHGFEKRSRPWPKRR